METKENLGKTLKKTGKTPQNLWQTRKTTRNFTKNCENLRKTSKTWIEPGKLGKTEVNLQNIAENLKKT